MSLSEVLTQAADQTAALINRSNMEVKLKSPVDKRNRLRCGVANRSQKVLNGHIKNSLQVPVLQDIGQMISTLAYGEHDMPCPFCGPGRNAPANRTRKVLRVWIDGDIASWNCARCGNRGHLKNGTGLSRKSRPRFAPAEVATNRRDTARWLWTQRQPIEGTPAEKYLREARCFFGTIPATLGYLSGRGKHPPAMIAAFGLASEPEPGRLAIETSAVMGVHLTKLTRDGRKVLADKAKMMVGPSKGWPIVLAPPNDLLGLAVCEGIETSLSIHEATGLGVWAAGSAGRMPALADAIPHFIDLVTISCEDDDAGRAGALDLANALNRRGLHYEVRV